MIEKGMKSLLLRLHSLGVHPWSKTTALSQYLVFLKGEEGEGFDNMAPPCKHEHTWH